MRHRLVFALAFSAPFVASGAVPPSPESVPDLLHRQTQEMMDAVGNLEGERTGKKPEPLLTEAPDVLFVPGQPRYRKIFQRGPDGKITGFVERREAWDILWTRAQ